MLYEQLRISIVAALVCFIATTTVFAQSESKSSASKSSSSSSSAKNDDDGEEHSIQAKVSKVIDGDSIKVKDDKGKEYEVQIEGTDAPEVKQPFGKESTEALAKLVKDKDLKVTWKKTDNFERLLAQVYVGDQHVNSEMIKLGMAWHFKRYNKSEELAKLETEAREAKRGLWADEKPVAPWDYRKENRSPDKPDR